MKGKITRKLINEFLSNNDEQCLYDTQVTGLHVRKRGHKGIYFLFYRNSAGVQRRPKIGSCDLLSPEQARSIAGTWLLDVISGGDPSEARKIEKREAKLPSTQLIFGDVAQQYLEKHVHVSAQQTGRKGTYKSYKGQVESHYFDVFRNRSMDSIKRSEVFAWHAENGKGTLVHANRLKTLMSQVWNWSEKCHQHGFPNPCTGVDPHKERPRIPKVGLDTFTGVWLAIEEMSGEEKWNKQALIALKVLMLSGVRKTEVLALKWEDIDFNNESYWFVTKGGDQTIQPLIPEIRTLFEDAKKLAGNSEWVFPSKRKKGIHLKNLRIVLDEVSVRAKCKGLRVHDFRHLYIRLAQEIAGTSVEEIMTRVGHKDKQTTHRYLGSMQQPVKKSAGELVIRLMKKVEQAKAGATGEEVDNGKVVND